MADEITREEQYLAKMAGEDVEVPEPITRKEVYYKKIIESGGGGGGGTSDYSDLSNKPSINSVTLNGNKTADDLGLQKKVEVVNETDTTITLDEDIFYIFQEMATLSVTVTGGGMYMFRFTSGSTPTTLTVTGATMPDSFTVEANKMYEVNIYQGYGVVSSWDNSSIVS